MWERRLNINFKNMFAFEDREGEMRSGEILNERYILRYVIFYFY